MLAMTLSSNAGEDFQSNLFRLTLKTVWIPTRPEMRLDIPVPFVRGPSHPISGLHIPELH